MEIELIQELKPYTFEELKILFNKDEDKLKNILKNLSLLNFIRKINSNLSKRELENLLETESLENIKENFKNDIYIFKYVGILAIGNKYYFSYPKYIKDIYQDKNNKYKKFTQILYVIQKYSSKEKLINTIDSEEEINFNILSFTLDLLKDYFENGLYSNNKTVIEENGNGEIFWDKTINEKTAYFSNSTPIYLNMYTIESQINEDSLFRRLHKSILTLCCKEIEKILEILNVEKVFLSSETLDDFGNEDYLIFRLEQEISQQFVTVKQKLLYKLIKYIKRNKIPKSEDTLSFIGTNSFNLVWEDVCQSVMCNSLNKTLYELNLNPIDNMSKYSLLSDVIPKPQWKHNISDKVFSARGTLIPDLITIKDNNFSIYDAKYYNIQLNEKGIKHQPGIEDITKQYLYELAYKKFITLNNLKMIENAFLFPTDEIEEKEVGYATFDIFLGINLKKIKAIFKPCLKMFEKYLSI